MIRFVCLAIVALAARAVEPPLPYIDTTQDNLMAMAGDVMIMSGSNSITMNDDDLTFKVGSNSYTLSNIKKAVGDSGVSREAIRADASSSIPSQNTLLDSAITNLDNSLAREMLDLNALVSSVSNTFTAVSNEASTLLGEMQDFDAVATGGNLDGLSTNVANFNSQAATMVADLNTMINDGQSSMEAVASSISTSYSTNAVAIESQMTSIEMAVAALPTAETSTSTQLSSLAATYGRNSFLSITSAERSRASASDNTLNSFIAARTNAQTQMDTLDSIETAVTTAFTGGRYNRIFTTSRSLLEGKYGGAVEVEATPKALTNRSSSYYGRECTASGDYFACAAYRYAQGAVAVYKMDVDKEEATLQQIIYAPKEMGTYLFAYFGFSIDMDGDHLVVGAYNTRTSTTDRTTWGRGTVYVYRKDSTGMFNLLGNVTGAIAAYDYCGYSVAMSGNRFAFSCFGQEVRVGTVTRSSKGKVFVYTVATNGSLIMEAGLVHTAGAFGGSGDSLGGGSPDALSMFGNTLVAGMRGYEKTSSLSSQGGAAVFEFANGAWKETTILTAPTGDAARFDYFGTAVEVGNGIIVASAPFHDPNASVTGTATISSAGSVWIFTRNSTGSWNVGQRLNDPDANTFDYLGNSLALNDDGTQLIASAHGDDGAGSGVGAVHTFSKAANGRWSFSKSIFHSDGDAGDSFGYGCSFGDDYYVAGAWFAEDTGSSVNHGKAWAFIDFELFPSA